MASKEDFIERQTALAAPGADGAGCRRADSVLALLDRVG
jgi:hypothetical protein